MSILEVNGQREGLCTGTAKSEPRYDIYLEQIVVYRYIVAALASIMKSYNFSTRKTEKNHKRKGIISSNKHRIS